MSESNNPLKKPILFIALALIAAAVVASASFAVITSLFPVH
ncbi:hypothetical protein [Specibacter sp. NPDC078692]